MQTFQGNIEGGKNMRSRLEFGSVDFEWIVHDIRTDSIRFYLKSDIDFTDEEQRRIVDAMLKAGVKELGTIENERENKNGEH